VYDLLLVLALSLTLLLLLLILKLLLLLLLASDVLAIPLERCAASARRATCAADQQQQCGSCLLAIAWPRPLLQAEGSILVQLKQTIAERQVLVYGVGSRGSSSSSSVHLLTMMITAELDNLN
jgi:hypothetical protein